MKMMEFPSRKESFLSRRGCRELAWMSLLIIVLSLVISVLSARYQMWALALTLVVVVSLLLAYGFFKGSKLSFQRIVIFLLVASILSPSIRLPEGIPDVRLELIIVLIAWGLFLLGHLATNYPIKLRPNPAYRWFTLFGLAILFSMTYAALVKGYVPIGRDFWELGKLLKYFLIFALVASLRISSTDMKRYYKIALIVFLCSAFFGFAQYLDLGYLNAMISPYYAPTQMRGLLVQGRIMGTTPNPNEFGALMVLAASLALSGVLFLQGRGPRMLCWSTLPIFGLALVLTLSRSALVALFLAAATVLFLFLRQKSLRRRLRRVVVLVLFGSIVGAFIFQLMPEKAVFRFGQLGAFTEAPSWQARVENWKTHFAIWTESPWLGWGPGKTIMGTIVDNEWLLLLRRYGVVGLAVFLCLFGSLFFGLSRIRKANPDPSVVALTVALQGTFVGYVLYMGLAAVYHSLQLMPIFVLFLGLAYSQWRPGKTTVQEVPKP